MFCGHPVTGLLQALAELCSLKSGLCVLWTSCDWSVAGFGRVMGLSYALGMSDGGIYCIPLNLMPVNGKVTENSGLPNK